MLHCHPAWGTAKETAMTHHQPLAHAVASANKAIEHVRLVAL